MMELVQLFPNETIQTENEETKSVYVVKSGRLMLMTSDGNVEIKPSMNYGLDSLFSDKSDGVILVAVTSSSILKIEIEKLSSGIADADDNVKSAFSGVHKMIKKRLSNS